MISSDTRRDGVVYEEIDQWCRYCCFNYNFNFASYLIFLVHWFVRASLFDEPLLIYQLYWIASRCDESQIVLVPVGLLALCYCNWSVCRWRLPQWFFYFCFFCCFFTLLYPCYCCTSVIYFWNTHQFLLQEKLVITKSVTIIYAGDTITNGLKASGAICLMAVAYEDTTVFFLYQ